MTKINEINYIQTVCKQDNVPVEEFENYLIDKPWSDPRRGFYLMDLAQILKLLPQPPKKLLDLGCGPGWTSKIFSQSGYDVIGLDISADMTKLAKINCQFLKASPKFETVDYEEAIPFGKFDIAVIYDALHHALDEKKVIQNVFDILNPRGVFITAEPGYGHSRTEDSLETIRKYGTTEKDMPFSLQKELMLEVGFSEVKQYCRLSELPLEGIELHAGEKMQLAHFDALITNTAKHGFTSIVKAFKS